MAQMAHENGCFTSVPFASGAGEMLQMLHFFRGFWNVTFGNLGVPFVKIWPYFSREWDKWDTASGVPFSVTFRLWAIFVNETDETLFEVFWSVSFTKLSVPKLLTYASISYII